MSEERFLVVNADDLGLSTAVNEGIFRAHREGVVTSASLMVRQGAAPEAATEAAHHPELAVGLHLDLGEWNYESGEWTQAYIHCDSDDRGTCFRRPRPRAYRSARGVPGVRKEP